MVSQSQAMELRSGRILAPRQRQEGGARRGRLGHRTDHHGGGVDRISALPDELLLRIIGELDSTAEAARTSVLARRWSPLWPELHLLAMAFRGVGAVGPGTLGDLLSGALRRPEHAPLTIHVARRDGGVVTSAEVSSLLRAAEMHRPAELILVVGGGRCGRGDPFVLPCFTRATSMEFYMWRRSFTLPPAGEFTLLENLSLSLCSVDPSIFLPRCPRLRKLVMDCYWEMDAVAVRSESLEEVVIKDVPLAIAGGTPRRVDVVAPLLNKFRLKSSGNRDLIVKLSEANVVDLSFNYCSISSCSVGFGCWRLKKLAMEMESSSEHGQVNLVRVLSLVIIAHDNGHHAPANRSFAEEIACLPVKNFSALKLELPLLDGIVFRPLVFHLLNTLSAIQRLQLVLFPNTMESYARSGTHIGVDEDISFSELEEVQIEGFDEFHKITWDTKNSAASFRQMLPCNPL